jgi:hypothetical protein
VLVVSPVTETISRVLHSRADKQRLRSAAGLPRRIEKAAVATEDQLDRVASGRAQDDDGGGATEIDPKSLQQLLSLLKQQQKSLSALEVCTPLSLYMCLTFRSSFSDQYGVHSFYSIDIVVLTLHKVLWYYLLPIIWPIQHNLGFTTLTQGRVS